eukprot:TRINITY_DN126382_c0_g1_i1.p1 TRINITY_DN126382_c0_g1~~TRINITY_DN126382_c0_g1_i1.p1  ORF type:complete len:214 (-),score=16.28 TRINITY_DN126382_c0_g1_i1:43-684(-)
MEGCKDQTDQDEVLEERLKLRHGCCCSCCSVRAGCWAMACIDGLIFTAAHLEWPPKEMVGLTYFFIIYVYGVVLPSFCCWLYALCGKGGWPSRLLCRFLMYKIPMFFLCYLCYFTWPAPDRAAWCPFYCDPDAKLHDHARTATIQAMFGKDVEKCCDRIGLWFIGRSFVWAVVFTFSFREAYHFFRAHPENDSKGIWFDLPDENQKLLTDKTV